MAASLNSPSDIVNAALVRIGWKQRVGSLYDGSIASRHALDVYGQTRDELLRMVNPDFAQRNAALTLLKSAPADGGYIPGVTPWDPTIYPPVNWLFEYTYPADCLKVRCVKVPPLLWPNADPEDNPFSIDNDSYYNPPQRVILCNVRNALLVYTGRVTDPTSFDVSFLEAFIAELGVRLAPALTGLDTTKLAGAEAQAEGNVAMMTEG
jgi:hypothetical protein